MFSNQKISFNADNNHLTIDTENIWKNQIQNKTVIMIALHDNYIPMSTLRCYQCPLHFYQRGPIFSNQKISYITDNNYLTIDMKNIEKNLRKNKQL